jgi:dCTP deaminase
MSVLPYQEIKRLSMECGMISPFSERGSFGGVSFGAGPASYDLRLDRDIRLWPGRSVRADAIERICMPDNLMGLLFSKSTWARVHVEHAATVIDPGFHGVLRLEINMHHGDGIIDIAAGTGIVQVVFCRLEAPTEQPYRGRYLGQGADQDAIFIR